MFNYLNIVKKELESGSIVVKSDNLKQLINECSILEHTELERKQKEAKRRYKKNLAKNQKLINGLAYYDFKRVTPSQLKQLYNLKISTQKITYLLLEGIKQQLFSVEVIDNKRLYSVIEPYKGGYEPSLTNE